MLGLCKGLLQDARLYLKRPKVVPAGIDMCKSAV